MLLTTITILGSKYKSGDNSRKVIKKYKCKVNNKPYILSIMLGLILFYLRIYLSF